MKTEYTSTFQREIVSEAINAAGGREAFDTQFNQPSHSEEEVIKKAYMRGWDDRHITGEGSSAQTFDNLFKTYLSEQTQPSSKEVEEKKYPIGGYAPGDYWCKCCDCKQQFMGDKRAVQCEPCAEKMFSTPSPSVKEETADLDYNQKSKLRNNGFYWVKDESRWLICECTDGNWDIGHIEVNDTFWVEIDECELVKSRQMHRNDGLDELIEWINANKWMDVDGNFIPVKYLLTKANEIKSRLNR